MKLFFVTVFLIVLMPFENESANILVTVPYGGWTHYFQMRVLARELLTRGHNVTVFANFKDELYSDHTNYTQIVVPLNPNCIFRGQNCLNCSVVGLYNFNEFMQFIFELSLFATDISIKSPITKPLLESKNQKFDLILSNMWYQEAFYMLAHKLDAPLILVSGFGNSLRSRYMTRNPLGILHTPHEYGRWHVPETLYDKLLNLYYFIYEMYYRETWLIPANEERVKQHFKDLPKPVPSLEKLESEVSLVLVNSHYSVDGTHHFGPRMIEIGGFHIPRNTTLSNIPQDLRDILDNAHNGFIFMSFGTKLNFTDFDSETHRIFMEAFGQIDQIVLIKADTDIAAKPKNVFIVKWLPQNEILSHKNIKLFITHAGLLSMQEATYYGVPVIGMPFFADQHINIDKAVKLGYAKHLNIYSISYDAFLSTLLEMLTNKSYQELAKEYSRRFRDRPLSALDTAMYWIEYVINHKGAKFLRGPRFEDPWYRYYGIDVIAVIVSISSCFCWIVVKCSTIVGKYLRRILMKTKIE